MNILDVKSVSKAFGGVQAVRDCSFEIRPEQVTALIGPNGAGKTTLFNVINGFVSQDAGRVIFAEQDVSAYPVWRRSRLGMSRTFQLARVFKYLSLRDNLVLAIRQNDDEWSQMLKRPNTTEYEDQIKNMLGFVGLNKNLDQSITALSYGEQKLFDLARALLNPHSLLLLDEPVAGVNPVLRSKLKEILIQLKNKKETVLLIEHDMDFVRSVADWVIVMDQGSVLTQGRSEDVLRDKLVLDAYLGPNH